MMTNILSFHFYSVIYNQYILQTIELNGSQLFNERAFLFSFRPLRSRLERGIVAAIHFTLFI